MAQAIANGIQIEYETFGNPADPTLLLVMGLGAQMLLWDEAFCEQLASRGFHVIRYDNRDTGLTTKCEGGPDPDIAKAMAGDHSTASYTLDDMAADAAGLLGALGIEKAHIVGASMGGMIVQAMAINHPGRVLSMCSIMSTTGNREVGQATPEAMGALMAPPPTTREEAIARGIESWKVIGGKGFPYDEAKVAARTGRAFDRCHYPIGIARQMVGIMASGDRTAALANVTAPTVVIHGADDPLVTLSGGEATANAIPGARLVVVAGMGHDMPEGAWPQIIDAIVDNTRRSAASK